MIYLRRYTAVAPGRVNIDLEVVEDTSRAARYEAQGYSRCTYGEFRAAWRLRDIRRLTEMRGECPQVAREAGSTVLRQADGTVIPRDYWK